MLPLVTSQKDKSLIFFSCYYIRYDLIISNRLENEIMIFNGSGLGRKTMYSDDSVSIGVKKEEILFGDQ